MLKLRLKLAVPLAITLLFIHIIYWTSEQLSQAILPTTKGEVNSFTPISYSQPAHKDEPYNCIASRADDGGTADVGSGKEDGDGALS